MTQPTTSPRSVTDAAEPAPLTEPEYQRLIQLQWRTDQGEQLNSEESAAFSELISREDF